MKLTRIRFVARWWDVPSEDYRFEQQDFKLGLGTCGKVVSELDCNMSENGALMEIVQNHDDETAKRFFYRMSDVLGRVEEIHE